MNSLHNSSKDSPEVKSTLVNPYLTKQNSQPVPSNPYSSENKSVKPVQLMT
jgi:hypothetical protein